MQFREQDTSAYPLDQRQLYLRLFTKRGGEYSPGRWMADSVLCVQGRCLLRACESREVARDEGSPRRGRGVGKIERGAK